MTRTDNKAKVKHRHSKACPIVGTSQEFYCPRGNMFFGNFAGNRYSHGNKIRGAYYYWLEMVCNYPDCKFLGVVNSDVLSDTIIYLSR